MVTLFSYGFIREMVREVSPLHHSFSEGQHAPRSHGFQVIDRISFSDLNVSENSFICQAPLLQGSLSSGFFSNAELQLHFGIILIDAVLVVLMTRVVCFVLKHLKQPKVVSEVIGGIIIGPSVLSINQKFQGIFLSAHAKYVIKNIGLIGFMYFLFVIGVKMDFSMIKFSRMKHRIITAVGLFVPIITASVVGGILRPWMDTELAKTSSIGAVVSAMAVTGFVVIYPILQELNLLSSEIGQLALSVSLITDAVGVFLLIICEALRQVEVSFMAALWYTVSVASFMVFSYASIRQVTTWILQKTPEGQPVEQAYVVLILLWALVMGFLSDMFGLGIATGSLWLGLAIPDGPPLGSTIVERSETFIMDFFMPLSYVYIGMLVDVFAMTSVPRSRLAPLLALVMTAVSCKLLATLLVSLAFKLSLRDALTLTLILNLRGQQEFVLIMHWIDRSIIEIPSFTMLVLLVTLMTTISTPLIRFLYDPSKPFMVNTRRSIQHNPPYKQLIIVACVHDRDSVASLIDLFEFSCPSETNPLSVYALHLIELRGQAVPVFIDHEKHKLPSKYAGNDPVYSALRFYKETKNDAIDFHSFTAVVPKETMYQDICKLAMKHEASLIVLPLQKEWRDNVAITELGNQQKPSVISHLLDHAPCSIGVLVHKSRLFFNSSFDRSVHHFLVLFLGGADSREALSYADRMVMNPNVRLTVIRLISHHDSGEYEHEKKLDNGAITWFLARNGRNRLVTYSEMVVNNGAETLATIQAIGNDVNFDLWIIGRQQGIDPVLLQGLSDWSRCHELGVIGDYISSMDFDGATSVLVVQQQILRG